MHKKKFGYGGVSDDCLGGFSRSGYFTRVILLFRGCKRPIRFILRTQTINVMPVFMQTWQWKSTFLLALVAEVVAPEAMIVSLVSVAWTGKLENFHKINLTNIAALLLLFTQGVYLGVFAGFSLSAWVFIGSVFYPPDTNPPVRSVTGCPFFRDALACIANISLSCANQSAEILAKYGDGLIRNSFKPYTR